MIYDSLDFLDSILIVDFDLFGNNYSTSTVRNRNMSDTALRTEFLYCFFCSFIFITIVIMDKNIAAL